MRRRVHFRFVSRLALLAAVLIAVCPTVTRVLLGGAAGPGDAICTLAGLRPLPAQDGTADGQGTPAPHAGSHEDCAYCPLAASLALPPVPALLLAPLEPAAARLPALPLRIVVARHFGGLGSRGPPVLP